MATVAEELSKSVADVAARVAPSVVGVGAGGSGVVVGAGLVVTNAHNIRRDEIVVTFADGRRADGRPAGVDVDGDLAVVAVDTGDAPAPPGGGRRRSGMGDAVLALANPGGRAVRVSVGFVSALDVAFRGPGGRTRARVPSSTPLRWRGDPRVGRWSTSAATWSGSTPTAWVTASIWPSPPTTTSRGASTRSSRGEVPRRPRLGIAVAPPRVARRLRQSVGLPERDGLLVHAVEEGGPADRAGIRQGDLVVRVAGTSVATVDELAAALESSAPDASVEVLVVRGADEVTLTVDLAEAPD